MALRFCIIICVIVLGFGTSSSVFAQEKTRISATFLPRAETAQLYDDAWWKEQYNKIHDTPRCQEIIPNTEKIRDVDRKIGSLMAPSVWAFGMYMDKGECGDANPDEALAILTDLAGQGEGLSAVYLAQFYYVKYGSNAPITQSWVERAKPAMVRVIDKNWRKNFYQSMANSFQKMGMPFSPQLESVFLWGEKVLNGNPEEIYQIGMDLLEHSPLPEAKVLACEWFYEAEKKEHVKARFQLARQLALGDGVKVYPRQAEILLELSANDDHNLDAFLLVAQLLQKGDVLKKHLSDAYYALLKAQALGGDVFEQLKKLEPQLTDKERKWALSRAEIKPSILDPQSKGPQAWQPICSYSAR